MMPHTVAHLDRLGVTADGHPLHGINYLDGRCRADAPFQAGVGRGVRRTVLHAALWRAAESAGVKLVHGELGEITQGADSVCAAGFEARYLAAADGLHSPIRTAMGLSGATTGRRRWGIRRHYEIAPWTNSVEVHWSRTAEAYVTPVADDCVGVAILSAGRGGFDRHFESSASCATGSPVTPTVRTGPRGRCGRTFVAGGRVACCWSATRPAISTRSPARAWGWRSAPPSCWSTASCATAPRTTTCIGAD